MVTDIMALMVTDINIILSHAECMYMCYQKGM